MSAFTLMLSGFGPLCSMPWYTASAALACLLLACRFSRELYATSQSLQTQPTLDVLLSPLDAVRSSLMCV